MEQNSAPERYAIFQTGGKQYQAIEGKTVAIEKLDAAQGSEVIFDEVLLRRTASGKDVEVGQPYLSTPVKAVVVKHDKDEKIVVYKFKRRKKYHCKKGHRQPLTVIRITAI